MVACVRMCVHVCAAFCTPCPRSILVAMFAIAVSFRLFCDFHVLRLSIAGLCCNDMSLLSCLLSVSVFFTHPQQCSSVACWPDPVGNLAEHLAPPSISMQHWFLPCPWKKAMKKAAAPAAPAMKKKAMQALKKKPAKAARTH